MWGKQILFERCHTWAKNKGNEVVYYIESYITIVEQVQGGLKGEQGWKQQQLATILHL